MQDPILAALSAGQTGDAVALAHDWVRQAPDDSAAHRMLAEALRRAGDAEAALASIDLAIELAPESAQLHMERAGILLGARQTEAAGQALARARGLDPNQFIPYIVQAQIELGRDQPDEAERLARTAARILPEHPYVAMIEGMVALQRGDRDLALRQLAVAAQRMPDDFQILYAQGFAYMACGHLAFAEQAFRRVLEKTPDNAGLRGLLAQLLQAQGRPDDALQELAPLLADPDSGPGVRRLAGEYAMQAGRPADALPYLRAALLAAPGDLRPLPLLREAWQRLGRDAEARDFLEGMVASVPQEAAMWSARLGAETSGTPAARAVAGRWVAAMSGHLPALEALMIEQDRAGDAASAEATARNIVALEPGRASGERRIVEALLQRSPDEAIAHVEALVARAPATARFALLTWLGLVQDQAGRPEAAMRTWIDSAAEQAPHRLPSWPVVGLQDAALPPMGRDATGTVPLLLWGAPGAMAERVALQFEASGRLCADRFGPTPPQDGFQRYATLTGLADGQVDPQALVAAWRAALPARGIGDGNLVDWLPVWDNVLLEALRPHLPEALLLIALRDPRDMLLDWLVWGSPTPLAVADPLAAAEWMAQVLDQVAELHERDLFPHRLIRLDGAESDSAVLAEAVGAATGIGFQPLPPLASDRFPSGYWRRHAASLAAPFARLVDVAVRFGYPAE